MPKPKTTPPNMIDRVNRPPLKYFRMGNLPIRPGAMDILNKPSRVAGSLFYPDGRVERGER